MRRFISLCMVFVLAGCAGQSGPPEAFAPDDDTGDSYHLGIAFDMSNSMATEMADDGKAWATAQDILDGYLRQGIGRPDRIIVAQLSAEGKPPLIWQGSNMDFRRDFDGPEPFRKLLKAKSNPNGSALHDGIATLINAVVADPAVAAGRRKAVIIALTDMEESIKGDPSASEARLVESLKKLEKVQSAFAVYYCDGRFSDHWRKRLQDIGFSGRRGKVYEKIESSPPLPSFE